VLTPPNTGDARTSIPDELMAAVAHGDHEAFGVLYDQLAAPVYGVVRAVVQDPAQAEDVVREVFVELWRTAFRYRGDRGGVRAWTMVAAHRHAVERARGTRGEEHPGAEQEQEIARHLLVLTDLERASIVLGCNGVLSYHDVAKALRVTSGTVTHRMRTGLRRLRDGWGDVA
jgi:RNA polymerase sigma-70 factor (ECF subfamily)